MLLALAAEAGISNSHMYYIESKRVVPSIDVCVMISKALGVEMKEPVSRKVTGANHRDCPASMPALHVFSFRL